MDNTQSGQRTESPAPEILHPQTEGGPAEYEAAPAQPPSQPSNRPRHGTYRPSHKATFIGLAVVVAILAVNAGIIAFVLKAQSKAGTLAQGQVIISQGVLDKLGVSRNAIGDAGIELLVNPNARFNGDVQVGGNVNVAGKLTLNSTFSATSANFTQLQAGKTSLSDLDVNGHGTFSTLNVRNDLVVAGTTRLQGTVTLSNLLTVNNSANVRGNLAVGGVLSVNSLHVGSLTADTGVTIGGHIITRGTAPEVTKGGSALGSNGTVSISGNDQAGTVAVNIGVGAVSGIVANVTFHLAYANTPHIALTAVGRGIDSFYINRSATGFSIGVNSALSPGGYAFDFIVAQ